MAAERWHRRGGTVAAERWHQRGVHVPVGGELRGVVPRDGPRAVPAVGHSYRDAGDG